MTIDVPYNAVVTSDFAGGSSHTDVITGVYDGVNYSNDVMEIMPCEPIL